MENLFDSYRALAEDEICDEAAFLAVISNGNYAKELKTRAMNMGTRVVNKISGMVKKEGVQETEVITVNDMVAIESEILRDGSTKEEVVDKAKATLIEKLSILGYKELDASDEENLSALIMKEAGLGVAGQIGANGTPAQKADDVVKNFVKKSPMDYKVNISSAKLSRELLAHFVWKVTPEEKVYLPTPIESTEEMQTLDTEYFAVMREKAACKDDIHSIEKEILTLETKIVEDASYIADLQSKLVFVDKRLAEFEIEKTADDNADYVSAKSVKKITEEELAAKKSHREECEEKVISLKEEKKTSEEKTASRDAKIEELSKKIAELVKEQYQGTFALTIANEAIEKLSKVYSAKDREVLSSVLKELASAKDPVLYASLKEEQEYSLNFIISAKAVGRINYSYEEGQITVNSILKLKRV